MPSTPVKFWSCPDGASGDMRVAQEHLAELQPTEVLVRHKAVGINFMDLYFRTGLYPNPGGRLGAEAAGVVEAVGSAVTGFRAGDRVAYASGPNGAYAEARTIDARHLVKIPDGIDFTTAAAMLLKGMTAAMLLTRTTDARGRRVLFAAAAGGVGLIAGQWLAHLGAESIGLVSGSGKATAARAHGYTHVLDGSAVDVGREVARLTSGNGVEIAYDGVGEATFRTSLASLAPRGMFVSFGAASGPVRDFAISMLTPKSLYLTRPTLKHFTDRPDALAALAAQLFEMVGGAKLKAAITTHRFADIPKVHQALTERRTSGSQVIEID
ncbi:MAG: quinone oxidoreductase [Pseudomonadota bacterium]